MKKQMKQWLMLAAAVALCGMMTGCNGKSQEQRPVNGTMDQAYEIQESPQSAPQAVYDAMAQARIDDRFETLMDDKTSGVAVYSMLRCSDTVSSEGYGVFVRKGEITTAFPQIRHGKMPRARYEAATGDLVILGSAMEGTGVNVELPYYLRFDDNGYASVVGTINPYEVQKAFCKVLTYSINGQDITFYNEGKELVTVTNHIEDMGDFMEDAIYIGEQITYSIEGPLTVHITPGLNFVTGKVLHYDDMPTFSAPVIVNLKFHKLDLGEIEVEK